MTEQIPVRPPGPPLEFSKFEGLGNDFIIIFVEDVTPELARFMCDRHFGIGADGVIRILPSSNPDYDFHFRLFNSDGGQAEVSGNGLRCVGRFLHEAGLWSQPRIKVETGGQVKVIEVTVAGGEVSSVRVDMGPAEVQGTSFHVGGASDRREDLAQHAEVETRRRAHDAVDEDPGRHHRLRVDATQLDNLLDLRSQCSAFLYSFLHRRQRFPVLLRTCP